MNIETHSIEQAAETPETYASYFAEQLSKLGLDDRESAGVTKPDTGLDITQIPFSLDHLREQQEILNTKETDISQEEKDIISEKVAELEALRDIFNKSADRLTKSMREIAKAVPERNFAENFETSFGILVLELGREKYQESFQKPELLPLMDDLKNALEEFDEVKKQLNASKETYAFLVNTLKKHIQGKNSMDFAQTGIHDPERVQATELDPIDTAASKGLRG